MQGKLTIVGNGVWHWSQAVQAVVSILIRRHQSTQVEVRLLRILLLVQTIRRALPDIDLCASNRLASSGIGDLAMHPHNLAVRRHSLDDAGVVGSGRNVFAVEGTENGGFGSFVVCAC